MSKKIMKYILVSIFLLTSFMAGVIFYISNSIDIKKINKTLVDQIESQLVGTKVSISSVDYSIGTKLKIELSGLEILEAKTNLRLAYVKEAKLQVSIVSVLFDGGSVDINIEGPYLNVFKTSKNQINWADYLTSTEDKNDELKELKIPSFLENSKVNLRLMNLHLDYTDKEKSNLVFEKILLKNVNFERMTAYEVVSNLNYRIDADKTITANVAFVGEFSLKNLVEKNDFTLKSYLDIKDIDISGLNIKVPNISSELDFLLDKKSNVKVTLLAESSRFLDSQLELNYDGKSIDVDIKKLNLDISFLPSFLYNESLKTNSASFRTQGSVKYLIESHLLSHNLTFSLDKAIGYKFKKENFDLIFSGTYINKKLSVDATINGFSGEVTTALSTQLSMLSPPSDFAHMQPISLTIDGKGLEINSDLFKMTESQNDSDKIVAKKSKLLFPLIDINFNLTESKIGHSRLSANGELRILNQNIKSKLIKFEIDNSATELAFITELKDDGFEVNYKNNTKGFNWKTIAYFLPLKFKEVEGIFDLDSSGHINARKNLSYDLKVSFLSKDGSLKGLDVKDYVKIFLGKLSKYIPAKQDLSISEKYDLLKFSLNLNAKEAIISSFNLIGVKKSLSLNLSGPISMINNPSYLVGSLEVKELAKEIKKNIGDERVPIKINGLGFSMKPDISYTTSQILKKASRVQVKKIESNLKDNLKKKASKLLKGFKL